MNETHNRLESQDRKDGKTVTDTQLYLHHEINSAISLRRERLFSEKLGTDADLADLVVAVFEHTGNRWHIDELRRMLQHRFPFGANPQSQICQACGNDARIARFGKGTYGLAAWRTTLFGEGPVRDKVVRLLETAGEPLHYQDIYVYLAREVESGGDNPASSLCSRYRYDSRIRSLGSGYYGLAAWYAKRAAA